MLVIAIPVITYVRIALAQLFVNIQFTPIQQGRIDHQSYMVNLITFTGCLMAIIHN